MIHTLPPARMFRARLSACFVCALALSGAFTPTRAADAAAPASTTPSAASPVDTHRPQLPLDYKDFASDYKPGPLFPEWYTVEIGLIETTLQPMANRPTGAFPEKDWPQALAVVFKPVSLSCVVGAKTRFDNVMNISVDKAGNPLGYELPMGQIIYFLARSVNANGIYFSLHFYDNSDLKWVANPDKPNTFYPITKPTIFSQDVLVAPNSYNYFYLSQHTDTVRSDTPV
ncbi:MAG TPA: hypothetical protein VK737_01365, partial [Opitutales bacterium]|nr:hypothetical protein [Opitutales bacterium]